MILAALSVSLLVRLAPAAPAAQPPDAFEGAPVRVEFSASVPDGVKKLFRDDLAYVRGIRGDGETGLHHALFGSGAGGPSRVDGPAYLEWLSGRFAGRVILVDYDDKKDSAFSDSIASLQGKLQDDYEKSGYAKPTLRLRPAYAKAGRVQRIGVLFHEARHAEEPGWTHDLCPGTKVAGCDKDPLGAYGIEAVMLKNIQLHCTNCSDQDCAEAGDIAGRIISRRILGEVNRAALRKDLFPKGGAAKGCGAR